MEGVPKLKYCDKRSGHSIGCAQVATFQIWLCGKGDNHVIKVHKVGGYRCDAHKNSSTVGRKVCEAHPFDQSYQLQKVNEFLRSLIGKMIQSKWHTAKELEVKYLKENGGVMCLQPITKKWKFVYCHEIKAIN
jgi:hypothetical protein